MKVLLISDQHFGINDFCIHQHRSIAKFYNETFFPTLISENIKYVFDLGDTFDDDANINKNLLDWSKVNYFDKLKDYDISLIVLRGNHNPRQKKGGKIIDAMNLLSSDYKNIKLIHDPTMVKLSEKKILFAPYFDFVNNKLSPARRSNILEAITNKEADLILTHNAFKDYKLWENKIARGGLEKDHFTNISARIISGHYHARSSTKNPNITYLGSPYALKKGEFNVERGLHILDLADMSTQFIRNKFQVFSFICVETCNELKDKLKQQNAKEGYVYIIPPLGFKGEIKKMQDFCSNLEHKNLEILDTTEKIEQFTHALMERKDYESATIIISHSNKYKQDAILHLRYSFCLQHKCQSNMQKETNLLLNGALFKALDAADSEQELMCISKKIKELSFQAIENSNT